MNARGGHQGDETLYRAQANPPEVPVPVDGGQLRDRVRVCVQGVDCRAEGANGGRGGAAHGGLASDVNLGTARRRPPPCTLPRAVLPRQRPQGGRDGSPFGSRHRAVPFRGIRRSGYSRPGIHPRVIRTPGSRFFVRFVVPERQALPPTRGPQWRAGGGKSALSRKPVHRRLAEDLAGPRGGGAKCAGPECAMMLPGLARAAGGRGGESDREGEGEVRRAAGGAAFLVA